MQEYTELGGNVWPGNIRVADLARLAGDRVREPESLVVNRNRLLVRVAELLDGVAKLREQLATEKRERDALARALKDARAERDAYRDGPSRDEALVDLAVARRERDRWKAQAEGKQWDSRAPGETLQDRTDRMDGARKFTDGADVCSHLPDQWVCTVCYAAAMLNPNKAAAEPAPPAEGERNPGPDEPCPHGLRGAYWDRSMCSACVGLLSR